MRQLKYWDIKLSNQQCKITIQISLFYITVEITKRSPSMFKTTYRRKGKNTFSYTLGGYTDFIRIGNEQKNIVFPFNEYARHLVSRP